MKTEVLLEPLADNRFRATGLGRFSLSVEGANRDEALRLWERAASALVPADAEVVTVDLPLPPLEKKEHPWAWFAGRAKDDPLYPLFLEQIEENRRVDEENEARKMAASKM